MNGKVKRGNRVKRERSNRREKKGRIWRLWKLRKEGNKKEQGMGKGEIKR